MDHYKTLEIAKTATADDIKRAYRRLASKHHPDKGGSKEAFQRIEEAYRTLSDPQKRQQYDQPPPQNPFGGFHGPFEDIINQFHKQQRQQRVYTVGIAVTLEQVALGSTESIHINGFSGNRLIQIQIPKGVENGQQVRYDGIMDDGILQVLYTVKPHPVFTRNGRDLTSVYSPSIWDLIIGTTTTITTLLGVELEIKIPARTRPGTQFRIPGRGLQINGQTGDQYLLINPVMPDTISNELLELIKQEQTTQHKL